MWPGLICHARGLRLRLAHPGIGLGRARGGVGLSLSGWGRRLGMSGQCIGGACEQKCGTSCSKGSFRPLILWKC